MIRTLQKRLIIVAMLSMLIVLSVIIGAINISNYRAIMHDADSVLEILRENNGKLTPNPDGINWRKAGGRMKSPELPFEIRYFSAEIAPDGTVSSTDTGKIVAVDSSQVEQYALKASKKASDNGILDGYRYLRYDKDGRIGIIFLDCGRLLTGFTEVLTISIIISLMGLLAVFIITLLLSRRIVKPFSETYAKQKRFITDAGHEIKTPITIIDADAEILEMETGENEWLSDIRNQAARLSALTNDLIYLSRMEETGRNQPIEFPISDLVSETAMSFQAPAITKHINFSMDIQPMQAFCGDPRDIRQLVSILMDNAVKYTNEGGNIRIFLEKRAKNIVLCVENTVDSISEDTLKNMFDRFYRGDPSRGSRINGYGIGLSIARAIVQAHKGKISAAITEKNRLIITATLPV